MFLASCGIVPLQPPRGDFARDITFIFGQQAGSTVRFQWNKYWASGVRGGCSIGLSGEDSSLRGSIGLSGENAVMSGSWSVRGECSFGQSGKDAIMSGRIGLLGENAIMSGSIGLSGEAACMCHIVALSWGWGCLYKWQYRSIRE